MIYSDHTNTQSGLDMQEARRRSRFNGLSQGLALLLASLVTDGAVQAGPKLAVGDLPPEKLGWAVSGERVNLSAYRGRVVIVSFWASWCPPCRKEMSALMALQRNVSRNELVVLAVNWQESHERFVYIKKILKDVDLTLISDESGHLGRQYDVDSIPHMVMIGRDGRIAAIHLGYGEDEIPQLVEEINAQLTKNSDHDPAQHAPSG